MEKELWLNSKNFNIMVWRYVNAFYTNNCDFIVAWGIWIWLIFFLHFCYIWNWVIKRIFCYHFLRLKWMKTKFSWVWKRSILEGGQVQIQGPHPSIVWQVGPGCWWASGSGVGCLPQPSPAHHWLGPQWEEALLLEIVSAPGKGKGEEELAETLRGGEGRGEAVRETQTRETPRGGRETGMRRKWIEAGTSKRQRDRKDDIYTDKC